MFCSLSSTLALRLGFANLTEGMFHSTNTLSSPYGLPPLSVGNDFHTKFVLRLRLALIKCSMSPNKSQYFSAYLEFSCLFVGDDSLVCGENGNAKSA